MSLLPILRRKAFWMLDFFKGKPIKKAYLEIRKIDEMASDNSYIHNYQLERWQKLKEHACSTVGFYRRYSKCDFKEFPVITKNDIRENQELFFSSSFRKENLIQMSTSGSTGTPFICYQDFRKKKSVNAEIIYYSEKVDYKLGENLSYIRAIVKQNKKSALKQFLQNQTLINCGELSDDGIEQLIRSLQDVSKKGKITLLGYASTYTAIKDYAQRKNISCIPNCNITGIISGSDMLFDETRQGISQLFGNVEVVSRYSNEENGVIGQDEGINNVFPINEANYLVEILDEQGDNVQDGNLGRIVRTDLYNYAMPMIRYDTGDIGAIDLIEINGRKKRCICNFSGRKVDVIYDSKGSALSPHLITNQMWAFTDITQFQVIQKDATRYNIKLNVPEKFDREDELIALMRSLLGGDAQICIERVHEIPVLASGKRRYIVNECKKEIK